jgi:hypothetical protein
VLERLCSSVTTLEQHLGLFFFFDNEDYSDKKSDICNVSGGQKIRVEVAIAVFVVIVALQFYQ